MGKTFYSPKFRSHFFLPIEPGELKKLFDDFKLIGYIEGYSLLDITRNEPHYHG